MGGKDQENLTGVLWWHLWPYILFYMHVHVYTGSTDMYHISPYTVPVRERVSHSGDSKNKVNNLMVWKHAEIKKAVA